MSEDPISHQKDFEGYRLYRSNSGNELTTSSGSVEALVLMAEFDSVGNATGTNGGFDSRGNFEYLTTPVIFDGDSVVTSDTTKELTKYYYKYTVNNLLNGWQYLFSVTSFDEGDPARNIGPLESGKSIQLVIPGTVPNDNFKNGKVTVYPNPYYAQALWDGTSERDKKIYFSNLPNVCEIRIYTLAGETVDVIRHDSKTYGGEDVRWFRTFGSGIAQLSGGEHAWDMISQRDQALATGLYLFTVKDLKSGEIQTGKFAIIK